MGSSPPKQLVGYKYHLGMHAVLCQAPIDAILEMKWQERTAWAGRHSTGRLNINKPDLFGGGGREGGVSGAIDYLPGDVTQTTNDYLLSKLGDLLPAFRGVVSLVFRRFYFGNNPYIKPWEVKVQNVFSTYGNWYPEKAPIGADSEVENAMIYIAMDKSDSMAGTKLANQYTAVKSFLETLRGNTNSIRLVAYAAAVENSTVIYNATGTDIDTLKAWIDALGSTTVTGTDYDAAVSLASSFYDEAADHMATTAPEEEDAGILDGSSFDDTLSSGTHELRKVLLFLTDGAPFPLDSAAAAATTLENVGAEVYCFNIDLADTTYTELLDNTADDGVPVVSSGDPQEIVDAFTAAFRTHVDINAAHILRNLVASPAYGGNGDSAVGTSFVGVADQLFDEGMGISIYHENPSDKQQFKELIEQHIDGHLYFDRVSGKWEVKLVRDDYTVGDLFTYDESNIKEWIKLDRPRQAELPNQITVTYTKRSDGSKASVTVINTAAVQLAGRVIPDKAEYLGFTRHDLASRVALRELATKGSSLAVGAFRATYVPTSLNIGFAFIVNEPRLGLNNMVARITEIEEGEGTDNSVVIKFVEDKFSIAADGGAIVGQDDVSTGNALDAQPPTAQLVEEQPYYIGVLELGQVTVDSILTDDPDAGRWHAACDRPTDSHLSAIVARWDTDVWHNIDDTFFAPHVVLAAALDKSASTAQFNAPVDLSLDGVFEGQLLSIDDEIMRVDGITVSNGVATVTVGRGCLDTVPASHAAGASAMFWQNRTASDNITYTAGEIVQVMLLPRTSTDILSTSEGTAASVTMNSRAIRPYPPGKLQLEGSYLPSAALPQDPEVTWAHRDRTAQTTNTAEDFTAASIGPEAGITYTVTVNFALVRVDFFDITPDVFAEDDWFFDPTRLTIKTATALASSTTSYSYDYSALDFFTDSYWATDVFDAVDWFMAPGGRAAAIEFEVKTTRDAYDCWQVPVVLGRPLLPPINIRLNE